MLDADAVPRRWRCGGRRYQAKIRGRVACPLAIGFTLVALVVCAATVTLQHPAGPLAQRPEALLRLNKKCGEGDGRKASPAGAFAAANPCRIPAGPAFEDSSTAGTSAVSSATSSAAAPAATPTTASAATTAAIPVTRWKVVYPGRVRILEREDLESPVVGHKWKCAVVRGQQAGHWLRLAGEGGYLRTELNGTAVAERLQDGGDAGGDGCAECAGAGEDCRRSGCCRGPGTRCYEKNASLASCKASCVEGPDLEDTDWRPWSCRALGPRTPGRGEVAKVEKAAWVDDHCSARGQECSRTKCCSEAGLQCYEKDGAHASCKADCVPGPDLYHHDSGHWTCEKIGMRAPGVPEHVAEPLAEWVPRLCAAQGQDCRFRRCCKDSGMQCYEKGPLWGGCKAECAPGEPDPSSSDKGPWSCERLGSRFVIDTTTTSTTTRTWGSPSLFCLSLTRSAGYEVSLLQHSLAEQAGIFACDAFAIFSTEPMSVTTHRETVDALLIKEAEVGVSKDNTAGNAELFMNMWEAVEQDGRYAQFDWTVKVDPDCVILPHRLREHVRPLNSKATYIRNCDKFPGAKGWPMVYGALEVVSRRGMAKYFIGLERCKKHLDWAPWGEDFFFGQCMKFLAIRPDDDFSIITDGVCTRYDCGDPRAAAFHAFKTASDWRCCWLKATGQHVPSTCPRESIEGALAAR